MIRLFSILGVYAALIAMNSSAHAIAEAAADSNSLADKNLLAVNIDDPNIYTIYKFSSSQQPAAKKINLTYRFFRNLAICNPGEFHEANQISDVVGSATLKHQIIGFDEKKICQLKISAPDNRFFMCHIPENELHIFKSGYFHRGVVEYDRKTMGIVGNVMDSEWNEVKMNRCQLQIDSYDI